GNVKDTLVSSLTLAFAFIGGFVSLWTTGTIFGISAGIGFIILFGVATIDGIVLLGVIRDNLRQRMELLPAIYAGVKSRIRPVVMIALMGSMGLLPAAMSTGMGSDRKSTRLNSSHVKISYAVFCLKKKNRNEE